MPILACSETRAGTLYAAGEKKKKSHDYNFCFTVAKHAHQTCIHCIQSTWGQTVLNGIVVAHVCTLMYQASPRRELGEENPVTCNSVPLKVSM